MRPARIQLACSLASRSSPFEHRVRPRITNLIWTREQQPTIQDLYAFLVEDAERNSLIVADVLRAFASGRLVLSGRPGHVESRGARLRESVDRVFILKGGMGAKQRAQRNRELGAVEGHSRIIVATGSYIGEGFDDSRLDTLFLAMPISWRGTLQQVCCRLHRLHDGKKVVEVYDYVDSAIPMLARMGNFREPDGLQKQPVPSRNKHCVS